MSAPTAEPEWLAVDLDLTLLQVNCFPSFVKALIPALLRRGAVLQTARLVVAGVRRKALGGSHDVMKAAICAAADRADRAALEQWAADLYARERNPEVAEIVANWDGKTLLTSSAPQLCADLFARLAGFDLAHGSGLLEGRFVDNRGPAKVARMWSAGITSTASAISDDPDLDAPMLATAARPLLVQPSGAVVPLPAASAV